MDTKRPVTLPIKDKPVWMEATEVADFLGLDHRYFAEKHCMRTDFPRSFRLTPRGRRRWHKDEILAYIETKREKAA